MDQEVKTMLETTLKETLPGVVEQVVENKVDEKVSSLEKAIADLNKSIKLGVADEEKANLNEAKKTMGAFFKALSKASNVSEIGEAQKALNEGTDWDGWYLVPTEFAREVFRIAWETGLVRKYARIIPMGTDKKDIATIVNSIICYWTSEGASYTESQPTFWNCELIAQKATALVSATNELIEDNMTDQEIWALMSELIGEAMGEFEDTNVLVSSTKFTPLLADTNINNVLLKAGTSIANLTYDDLIAVIRAVPMKYKKGTPRWIMSQDVVKYIETLKDDNKQPIFYATRSLRDWQVENYLLWYPVEISDVMPGDTEDGVSVSFLLFGDLKHYALGDRRQLTFQAGYMSGNWEKDIQSLKASERIAWKVIFPKAFAKLTTRAS